MQATFNKKQDKRQLISLRALGCDGYFLIFLIPWFSPIKLFHFNLLLYFCSLWNDSKFSLFPIWSLKFTLLGKFIAGVWWKYAPTIFTLAFILNFFIFNSQLQTATYFVEIVRQLKLALLMPTVREKNRNFKYSWVPKIYSSREGNFI